MGATGKQTKVRVEVEDPDGGGKVPLGSSATSEKRGGALLFDSDHARGDVVEDGETVLATRSMRTIHIPLVGEVAVHMLDVPHGRILPSAHRMVFKMLSLVIPPYRDFCMLL